MMHKTPFKVQIYKQAGKDSAGETMKISLNASFYKKYAPTVNFYETKDLEFDENGDAYLTKNTSQQDLMHLKGVIVKGMEVFNQTLNDIFEHFPDNKKVHKAIQRWKDAKPLDINVNKYVENDNPYYLRNNDPDERPSLNFFEFTGPDEKKVKTYQSLNIVAQQLGYFLLDVIKRELDSLAYFAKGLNNSFADLFAIFLILELDELRDLFIQNTKGDLARDSFLTNLAEEYGAELILRAAGLRTATLNGGKRFHPASQIFTGAIYMTLVNLFDYYRYGKQPGPSEDPERFKKATDYQDYTDLSVLLKQIARNLRKFLVFAIIETGPSPTFCDIKDILKKYAVESIVETAFEAMKITREWEERLE